MKKSATGYILAFIGLVGLLLGIAWECSAQKPCDFVIKTAEYSWDGRIKGVKPGQVVCFQSGTRSSIDVYNLIGTPESPVILTNEPTGKVNFQGNGKTNTQGLYTTPFAIQIHGSKDFRVTGANNPAEEFAFEIQKSHMGIDIRSLSTDFEVDHLYVHDVSSVALVFKSDPSCSSSTWRGNFTMKNIKIHHNKVENTVNEMLYLGNSHYSSGVSKSCGGVTIKIFEHDVINAEVYENTGVNIGYDGIQVGSVISGMDIHNNTITNAGTKKAYGHMSHIQVNPGSTGIVRNNTLKIGTGFGIFLGGSGGISVYENLITDMEQGAILASDFTPIIKSPFLIHNNTIINVKDFIVWGNTNNTVGNSFANNIVSSTRLKGDGFYYNSSAQKLTWKLENNVINPDIASLKLDFDFVPTKDSPADKLNVGYRQRLVTTEVGTVEVIDSEEIWIVTPNGRYRIK